MKLKFVDKPFRVPKTQVNGEPLKSIVQVLLERRATPHFSPDPIPDEYVDAILRLGAQAPSGFNLQPWRFIVVRDPANRQRLQKAAMDQAKVGEAPVVIIAFALKNEWRHNMEAILQEGARRGAGKAEEIGKTEKMITDFLGNFPAPVWVNRHTMIAFTTMMLVAEAYGLDTAPMEGFDPAAVKAEFSIPEEAEVVALLALGFGKDRDKAYGGRLSLEETTFDEEFGQPWDHKSTTEKTPIDIAPVMAENLNPV